MGQNSENVTYAAHQDFNPDMIMFKNYLAEYLEDKLYNQSDVLMLMR